MVAPHTRFASDRDDLFTRLSVGDLPWAGRPTRSGVLGIRSISILLVSLWLGLALGESHHCYAHAEREGVVSRPTAARQESAQEAPYIPTADRIVAEMLRLANVTQDDVVYDLGSGDGRIVIAAARDFGARAVGVEIDPELVKEARENARRAGVSDRVAFLEQDLFETDLGEATVVTLYLLPEVNLRLRPKLLQELRPGTRVVSNSFDMGDWTPDRVVEIYGRTLYLWEIRSPSSSRARRHSNTPTTIAHAA